MRMDEPDFNFGKGLQACLVHRHRVNASANVDQDKNQACYQQGLLTTPKNLPVQLSDPFEGLFCRLTIRNRLAVWRH